MALETRRNKQYFYQKRREGSRVISEYVGGGPVAEYAALHQEIANDRREEERYKRQEARRELSQTDPVAAELHDITSLLVKAHLITNGFHQHKGTWRKRRKAND